MASSTPSAPSPETIADKVALRRYEYVCDQVALHHEGTRKSFDTFLKIATGLVGGAIWLSLNEHIRASPREAGHFGTIADLLMIGLAAVSCIKIREHMRAWEGNRNFLADLNRHYGMPLGDRGVQRRSLLFDWALIAAIMAGCAAFLLCNPLRYRARLPAETVTSAPAKPVPPRVAASRQPRAATTGAPARP